MVRWRLRRHGALLTVAAVLTLAVTVGLVVAESSSGGAPGVTSTGAVVDGEANSAEGVSHAADVAPRAGVLAAPSASPQLSPQLSKIDPPEPGPDPVPGPVPVEVAPDRSVVRTARLALTVTDLPAVSGRVRDTAASVGGFVASEHSVDQLSSFTLRVPSTRLDEVLGRLAGSGTVTERFGQTEDVTDQMVDIQSRLATQQASVARVRALLARANTVGEVVSVESELTAREAELESLQRRLASVSGRVSLATLTVSLTPVPVVAPQPGGGFLAGLAAGWRAFVAATGSVLTALGAVLPFAVLLGLVGAGVLFGRRAARRHRAATAAPAAAGGGSGKS
ncbi:MAG: DUF4349 domain-containing protein [Pseudonocardia sp.]